MTIIFLSIWIYKLSCRERDDGKGTLADKLCFIVPAVITFFVVFAIAIFDGLSTDDIYLKIFITTICAVLGIFFLYFPLMFTSVNVRNLVRGFNRHTLVSDIITIIIGGIDWLLFSIFAYGITGYSWNEAIYFDERHESVSGEYGWAVHILIFLGFISLIMICRNPKKKYPPLVSAFLTSSVTIMLALFLVVNIQIFGNDLIELFFMGMYYLNIFIIAVRRIRFNIKEQVRIAEERETSFRSKFAEKLHKFMSTVSGMTLVSFLMIIPIIAICEIIYIITGQGADGIIKAFTMTADWTFSQQTPPPPMDYEGHYLCTVAVCGHKKIVKPLRYGIRRGEKIVVNRQLLTANAFEDLIMEKMPKFHRVVRSFYDKHGYPLSKHITTKLRADVVYILMKPLEFIFVTVLYLFDEQPENRIARQYTVK